MNFRSEINWIKLGVALVLMCSMFGFTAMAQNTSHEPLDAEAVTALLDELKEGLPDLIDDEDQVKAITEKWDAREDLASKTKSQILKLLFDDVKSIVTDEEITKKIWESWNSDGEETKTDPPVQTPQPQPTPNPTFWLKFVHNGAYIAHFDLSWDEPKAPGKSWKSGSKTPNYQETVNLPADATNIKLKIENDTGLVWQPQREIINKVLLPGELNKCYRVFGTTLGSGWDNNCQ